MNVKRLDLGAVSAYAIAVEHGYTGTEEEFAMDIANAAINASEARKSAEHAQKSAEDAGKILNDVKESGETQITAIENAAEEHKNASIEAIDEKGKETLESIPDSYEALQGDVNAIKMWADGISVDEEGYIIQTIEEAE